MEKLMEITPYEAHILLFAVDAWCKTDSRGRVRNDHGFDKTIQSLRSRLFAIHNHKKDK